MRNDRSSFGSGVAGFSGFLAVPQSRGSGFSVGYGVSSDVESSADDVVPRLRKGK